MQETRMLDAQRGGLRILVRRNALTENDWLELLAERQALIKPYLRDMTLKSLGDLKIVHDDVTGRCGIWGRPLREGGLKIVPNKHSDSHRQPCVPEVVSSRFTIDARGIFSNDEVFYGGHFKWDFTDSTTSSRKKDITIKFWGLTRNNEWIRIEVPIKNYTQLRSPGIDNRQHERAGVEKVVVHESNPQEICELYGFTPKWIWQELGNATNVWIEHRRKLLVEAERLGEVVRYEEMMLDIHRSVAK